jgi:energy-coupling factor transporter transmembrane protein EcfT
MSLPSIWLAAGILTAAAAALLCGFILREQLTDLRPAFFYALFMYGLSVFSAILETGKISSLSAAVFIPNSEFLRISLRLVLIVQISALFFRSTSSLELREGLAAIERFFRKQNSPQSRFAVNITLFLCFIPEIFETWTGIDTAWKARAGKQGAGKIKMFTFVLISLSLEKAAVKAKALAARSCQGVYQGGWS